MTQDTRARTVGLERSDPEQTRRSLQTWGDAVKREQLQKALERLESQGQINAEQHQILEEMSSAIVDELLGGVDVRLSGDGDGGQVRAEAIVDLFDCQPSKSPPSTD